MMAPLKARQVLPRLDEVRQVLASEHHAEVVIYVLSQHILVNRW